MTETVSTALQLIREYHKADIPTFISGPPGVGKSSIVRQLAAELKIGFIDLRLAQMDPVDLRGLPKHVTDEQGVDIVKWARPDYWPVLERDGEHGIILYDELSDCGRAMQSAAYQPILDRRVGPHVLLPGWYPIGAGNRREDKAGAQAMSTALATRFAWINVEADVEAFREYGMKNNFHPFVLGFLKHRPGLLFSKEGANSDTFACPRQWERVSKICDRPESVRYRLVRGLVGEGAAGEFESTIKAFNLPSLEDIVADPKRCRMPDEPAEKYALASMLAQFSTRKNLSKINEYCKRDGFGKDFWICMMMDATKRDPDLCDTPAFASFASDNQDVQR